MVSHKIPIIIIAIVFVCAISISFASILLFEKKPAAKIKYNYSESTVYCGYTQSGGSATSYQFPLSDGTEIWESTYSYESTNEAEVVNLEMLKEAKEIIEQGIAPEKGYDKYPRTVAVFSDYVAIFGIKGESLFYCIKAPSLELAIDFEKQRQIH